MLEKVCKMYPDGNSAIEAGELLTELQRTWGGSGAVPGGFENRYFRGHTRVSPSSWLAPGPRTDRQEAGDTVPDIYNLINATEDGVEGTVVSRKSSGKCRLNTSTLLLSLPFHPPPKSA
jgi:hypothetical protein